jgi:hypothetical protein
MPQTKQDLLLDLLQDGQWHHSDELCEVADARYGDVVHKLRKKKYIIEAVKENARGTHPPLPKRSESGQKSYYRLANPREMVTESAENQLSLL